jgi:hypothetical protein
MTATAHGYIGDPAVQLSVGAMLEAAARRIGRRGGHCGLRQRRRVDVRRVAASMGDDDRMIRHGGIEIGARHGTRRLAVIVEITLHPASGRRVGRAGTQRRENLVD